MARGYYVIHSSLKEDMRRIWASGTCTLTSGFFRLFQWKPYFDPYEPEIQTHVQATRDLTYGYYARILVDLDLSIDLPKSIMVKREIHRFSVDIHYKNLPHIRSNCGIIGHQVVACRKIKSNNSVGGKERSKVLKVYKPTNQPVKDKNKDLENSKKVLEEIRATTNCESLNSNHDSREIK
ncbi:hypothetical protein Ddye_015942 [Dipteronia dyeriana]|uniref:DUF4283 domain-containing protein n=1 Tax=Dipteronia dyeriana TaxID=168575 RepID=A0AAD9WZM4_9ROSI|nr:hypothetical protein Ddye_015942 [Dipteronia dyeriana]